MAIRKEIRDQIRVLNNQGYTILAVDEDIYYVVNKVELPTKERERVSVTGVDITNQLLNMTFAHTTPIGSQTTIDSLGQDKADYSKDTKFALFHSK